MTARGGLRRREGTVRSVWWSVSELVLLWLDHIVLTCWASMVMSCSTTCLFHQGDRNLTKTMNLDGDQSEACIYSSRKLRRWMQGENFNSVEGPSCKKADVERLGLQPHQSFWNRIKKNHEAEGKSVTEMYYISRHAYSALFMSPALTYTHTSTLNRQVE